MNGNDIFQAVCAGLIVASLPYTFSQMVKAERNYRIALKILNREPLTEREQRALARREKAKAGQ